MTIYATLVCAGLLYMFIGAWFASHATKSSLLSGFFWLPIIIFTIVKGLYYGAKRRTW